MIFPQLGCPSSAALKKKKLFFAIEGQDGTGKGTQAILLTNKLMEFGLRVLKVGTPVYGSPACHLLERWRNGKFDAPSEQAIAFLYAHDRFALARDVVVPVLTNPDSEYDVVVADRWTASNVAHCGGRIFNGHETSIKEFEAFFSWIIQLEHDYLGIPRPINLVLDVSPENSEMLVRKRATEMDKVENTIFALRQAKTIYDLLVKRDPDYHVQIDCQNKDGKLLPEEEITENLFNQVARRLWPVQC